MENILRVSNVNDYVEYVGAKVLHPHVAVIHYDELGEIKSSLNNYSVYGLFLQREFPYNLTYGMGDYNAANGSLIAVAPGQIGGLPDHGKTITLHGWVLMFDQDFIRGTDLESHIGEFHFFSYNNNEALRLQAGEKRVLATIIKMIRMELADNGNEPDCDDIVRSYIQIILQYCQRFYSRQFHQVATGKGDVLARFRKVLEQYYEHERQFESGTPSVSYCAGELFLSPNYFGDIVKNATGDTATHYIRHFIIDKAKSMIVGGKQISETAYALGFDYPQHFTRVFKQETGMSPSLFLSSITSKRSNI